MFSRNLLLLLSLAALLLLALPLSAADAPGITTTAALQAPPSGLATAQEAGCNTDVYDSRVGVKIFRQDDGMYHVYGDCQGANCRKLATVDPRLLTEEKVIFRNLTQSAWYVTAYSMGNGRDGDERPALVYQLNTYNAFGGLVDDNFWIYLYGDGTSAWQSEACVHPSYAKSYLAAPVLPHLSYLPVLRGCESTNLRSTGDSGMQTGAAGPYSNGVYTVVSGDTLCRIARRFNVNVFVLAQANRVVNLDLIHVGQRLLIP